MYRALSGVLAVDSGNSEALLNFVLGGGVLAVMAALAFGWREIKAGRVAAKKGDLDSLKDILGEQRTEMASQRERYDQRITDLEIDLRAAEERARAAEAATQRMRRHLVLLEGAMRSAGIDVPEWQER